MNKRKMCPQVWVDQMMARRVSSVVTPKFREIKYYYYIFEQIVR